MLFLCVVIDIVISVFFRWELMNVFVWYVEDVLFLLLRCIIECVYEDVEVLSWCLFLLDVWGILLEIW